MTIRDWLAPTQYAAVIWAVGFLLIVAAWTAWHSYRMKRFLGRLRIEDSALWRELDSPETWQDLGRWQLRGKFRRLRADPNYGERFNPLVVDELRELQRWTGAGLILLAALGCLVLYLVWPYR